MNPNIIRDAAIHTEILNGGHQKSIPGAVLDALATASHNRLISNANEYSFGEKETGDRQAELLNKTDKENSNSRVRHLLATRPARIAKAMKLRSDRFIMGAEIKKSEPKNKEISMKEKHMEQIALLEAALSRDMAHLQTLVEMKESYKNRIKIALKLLTSEEGSEDQNIIAAYNLILDGLPPHYLKQGKGTQSMAEVVNRLEVEIETLESQVSLYRLQLALEKSILLTLPELPMEYIDLKNLVEESCDKAISQYQKIAAAQTQEKIDFKEVRARIVYRVIQIHQKMYPSIPSEEEPALIENPDNTLKATPDGAPSGGVNSGPSLRRRRVSSSGA